MTTDLFQFGQQQALPDPCAGRHGGNKASRAAFRKVQPFAATMRGRVLAVIVEAGLHGATSKEIAAAMGIGLHRVSGRLAELKKLLLVQVSDMERDGAAVLVARSVLYSAEGS